MFQPFVVVPCSELREIHHQHQPTGFTGVTNTWIPVFCRLFQSKVLLLY
jgi:hypothetical protein